MKSMKATVCAIICAAVLAFVLGCYVTIKCAVPIGNGKMYDETGTVTNGYIISYRYGKYWRNEFYAD